MQTWHLWAKSIPVSKPGVKRSQNYQLIFLLAHQLVFPPAHRWVSGQMGHGIGDSTRFYFLDESHRNASSFRTCNKCVLVEWRNWVWIMYHVNNIKGIKGSSHLTYFECQVALSKTAASLWRSRLWLLRIWNSNSETIEFWSTNSPVW